MKNNCQNNHNPDNNIVPNWNNDKENIFVSVAIITKIKTIIILIMTVVVVWWLASSSCT